MIYTTELVLSLLISGVGLFLGFYYKKRALLLSLAAGFLLLITGISVLSTGFGLESGLSTNTYYCINSSFGPGPGGSSSCVANETLTVTSYVYEAADSTLSSVVGWFLLIIGFSSLVGSSLALYNQRYESEDL